MYVRWLHAGEVLQLRSTDTDWMQSDIKTGCVYVFLIAQPHKIYCHCDTILKTKTIRQKGFAGN